MLTFINREGANGIPMLLMLVPVLEESNGKKEKVVEQKGSILYFSALSMVNKDIVLFR